MRENLADGSHPLNKEACAFSFFYYPFHTFSIPRYGSFGKRPPRSGFAFFGLPLPENRTLGD
jgi:hypothetical protein